MTTEEKIAELSAKMGFTVDLTFRDRSNAVLKGIAMNPMCKPSTRLAALQELERRTTPEPTPEPTATA